MTAVLSDCPLAPFSAMSARFRAVAAAAAFSLSGCISFDQRAWNEAVDKSATLNLAGRFENFSTYVAHYTAVQFADLILFSQCHRADSVLVQLRKDSGLFVECFGTSGTKFAERLYRLEDGLRITDEGKIELPSVGGCGSGDAPVLGCASVTVSLFVNPRGDLVAIKSGGGMGFIGIIPAVVGGNEVGIFPPRNANDK